MATARLEKVKEFLTCTICTDEYTDPCTLRCQHSFCRKCVTKYIKSRPDALESKTIPCPCCRQVTKVPKPTRQVDEWAGQLKPSIIIQGLIDASQYGQATSGVPKTIPRDGDQRCNVCEHLGETNHATSWCPHCDVTLCDRCTRTHRATPSSCDHDVCDLSARSKVRIRKVMCKEHQHESVKFHCKDCKKSACQTCSVIYHRACRSVVTIQSLKSEMKSLLSENRQIMSKKLECTSVKLNRKTKAVNQASRNTQTMKSQIKTVSQKAIDKITQKEKQLMDKLDEVTEKHISQLQADVKTEEIEMQMYRQHCEFIDQTLISDCVMDMYDLYQACESGALVLGDDRERDTPYREMMKDIKFTHDVGKVQRVLDNLQLGEIDVTNQDVSGPLSYPVLIDTTDVRTESDKKDPGLYDITVLYVNEAQTAVVTDLKNNCVKSFYTRRNQPCHSRLPLDGVPCGMTQVQKNQVMVAVPNSHQIVKINVRPYLEHLKPLIQTAKQYISLAVLQPSSMAACCSHPEACVDILNMQGEVLKSISSNNNTTLFELPRHLCVDKKGNIVVTDEKKSVICVTSNGDVLWRYSPTGHQALSMPRGITTTAAGSLFVVDRDTSRVIELTDTGEYVRDVLTSQNGITAPRGLGFDEHGSLFVCDGGVLHEYIFT